MKFGLFDDCVEPALRNSRHFADAYDALELTFRTKVVPTGGRNQPKVFVGLSGRKKSGKSTLCRFLKDNAQVLWPAAPYAQAGRAVTLGQASPTAVEVFSFAGPVKKFCVDILGLKPEQCYGTEEQKNSPTAIRWEDLPHYARIVSDACDAAMAEFHRDSLAQPWWRRLLGRPTLPSRRAWFVLSRISRLPVGFMTGREVMQHFGTDVVRSMRADAWEQALATAVRESACRVALADDVRFPGEADVIKSEGGVVYRLRRGAAEAGSHESETRLDAYDGFTGYLPDGESVESSCLTLCSMLATDGLIREVPAASLLKFPA